MAVLCSPAYPRARCKEVGKACRKTVSALGQFRNTFHLRKPCQRQLLSSALPHSHTLGSGPRWTRTASSSRAAAGRCFARRWWRCGRRRSSSSSTSPSSVRLRSGSLLPGGPLGDECTPSCVALSRHQRFDFRGIRSSSALNNINASVECKSRLQMRGFSTPGVAQQ